MARLKVLHAFGFSLTNLACDGDTFFEALAFINASEAYAIQTPTGKILKVIFNSPDAMHKAKQLAINWEEDDTENALLAYMRNDYLRIGQNSFSCFVTDAMYSSTVLLKVTLSDSELMLSLCDGHTDEEMDDEIDKELVIKGIETVSYCGLCIRLRFNSITALELAKQQTGWEQYDELSLIMSGFNDSIVTREPCEITGTKTTYYYGDWQLKPLLNH